MLSQTDLTNKKSARLHFAEKRALLNTDEKKIRDTQICEQLASLVADAPLVLLFYPVKNEPDLRPLAEHLLSLGTQVAFPISIKESLTLDFRLISSLNELKRGAYGIPEPAASCPSPADLAGAVCITPALALDMHGYRLGYGKGYYDRFLQSHPNVHSIGVAYRDFIAKELPHNEHDIPLDLIITEKGAIVPNE